MLEEPSKQPSIPTQLDAELQAAKLTLQASRYATLEDLLKTQQWREADHETYRLMITMLGEEEGECFDRDGADLESFPCDDLQTLDQLWVNYSQGKWGFSVQRRIWQECGSPMDYSDNWKTFFDRVGWLKNGYLVNYDDFTFDLGKTLTGQFPVGLFCIWGMWCGGGLGSVDAVLFSSLAWRLVNCSTPQS